MKTQIITLQSHDDLVSVRDRMSWAKSPRVLLVWPGFERVALRPIDLRMLQQHAHYLGAELGLVTRQAAIRRDAEGFGIPVFRSPKEAQLESWPSSTVRRPDRRAPATNRISELRSMQGVVHPRPEVGASLSAARVGVFIIAVLAVLILAALFVPKATITLQPASVEQSLSLTVAAAAVSPSGVVSGTVPLRPLAAIVSGTQSARVATQAKVPEDKAEGVAHFQNLTQSEIVIPAGTIVYSTSPTAQRFVTLDETKLDAKLGSSTEVPIEAVQPGEGGNVPANAIQAIEGSLGTAIVVSNPDPTKGGSDRLGSVPTAGDRERVRTALLNSLQSQAESQLAGLLQPGDVLLPSTLKLEATEEETYAPAAGQPGSLLTLTMRLRFGAQYVGGEDLKRLAAAALNASVPQGYRARDETLKMQVVGSPSSDASGVSHLVLNLTRTAVRDLNTTQSSLLIRGLSPEVAAGRLQAELPLDARPQIKMDPPWWPWLPLIPFRITIDLR